MGVHVCWNLSAEQNWPGSVEPRLSSFQFKITITSFSNFHQWAFLSELKTRTCAHSLTRRYICWSIIVRSSRCGMMLYKLRLIKHFLCCIGIKWNSLKLNDICTFIQTVKTTCKGQGCTLKGRVQFHTAVPLGLTPTRFFSFKIIRRLVCLAVSLNNQLSISDLCCNLASSLATIIQPFKPKQLPAGEPSLKKSSK